MWCSGGTVTKLSKFQRSHENKQTRSSVCVWVTCLRLINQVGICPFRQPIQNNNLCTLCVCIFFFVEQILPEQKYWVFIYKIRRKKKAMRTDTWNNFVLTRVWASMTQKLWALKFSFEAATIRTHFRDCAKYRPSPSKKKKREKTRKINDAKCTSLL